MPHRELRVVATERVVGLVAIEDQTVRFDGVARQVFSRLRRDLGDTDAAQRLLNDGWSNGYLYLA